MIHRGEITIVHGDPTDEEAEAVVIALLTATGQARLARPSINTPSIDRPLITQREYRPPGSWRTRSGTWRTPRPGPGS